MNDPVVSHTVAVRTRWAAKKKRLILLHSDVDGLVRAKKISCDYKKETTEVRKTAIAIIGRRFWRVIEDGKFKKDNGNKAAKCMYIFCSLPLRMADTFEVSWASD